MTSFDEYHRRKAAELENVVIEAVPIDLEHVPDEETEEYDARIVADVDLSAEVAIVGKLRVEQTTPIEIKTCQVWINDAGSKGSRRRGRFKIYDAQHERLVELGGAYLLVLLDEDELVDHALVTASVLDIVLAERWSKNGGEEWRQTRDQVAQPPWSEVFDADHVDDLLRGEPA